MELDDFNMLLENAFEVPFVDEAFYRAFCGEKPKNVQKSEPCSASDRKAVVQKILAKKQGEFNLEKERAKALS